MSRGLPSAIESRLDQFIVEVYFVRLEFDTDPLYLHTDLGDIVTTVPNATWLGTAGLGTIATIEETMGLEAAPGVKLRLATTEEGAGTLFEELTQQDFYQRPVEIYYNLRNEITGDMIEPNPFPIWYGRMDVPEFVYGEGLSGVDLICEAEFADGKQKLERLYTDAALQAEYPGDTLLRYIAAMVNTKITWGAKRLVSLGGTGGQGNDPYTPPPGSIPEIG